MARRRAQPRERLDRLLVERGLAPTRARAQAFVMAGRVRSGGVVLLKSGALLGREAPLELLPAPVHVSRAGPKLERALLDLEVDARGRMALDVGASTGGFTQVLLLAGATRVIALDVGHGQLDWSLRNDPRVLILEGHNARYLKPRDLPFLPSLAAIDVSFISLELVLPSVVACLTPEGEVVALVKPQFEVGRGQVGRGGIVRDPELHRRVLRRLHGFAAERRWAVRGLVRSAVKGAEGNVEFFVHVAPRGGGLAPEALERALETAVASAEEEPA